MLGIIYIFALWIVGSSYPMISGKSIAASTFLMIDKTKKIDNMPKRKTLAEVKCDFEKVWGDRFIYDLITDENYVNATSKVPIVCKEHGVFFQSPHSHLRYCGCKECSYISRSTHDIPRMNVRKKIFGVGVNDSKDSISNKREKEKSYELWKAMLTRCYSKKSVGTSYEKCNVCDSWLYYSNFKAWFDENYKEGYHLDKDILVKGNKIYSPTTCCCVPPEINTLMTKHNATRGNLPIGVSKCNQEKYRAIVRICGKYKQIGTFDTPEEAFQAYKQEKETHIKEMAKRYFNDKKITDSVYNALMNYKVEITD